MERNILNYFSEELERKLEACMRVVDLKSLCFDVYDEYAMMLNSCEAIKRKV